MGIGIRCLQGVLLVADSLEPVIDPADPRYPMYRDWRKIQWLQGTHIASVVSGYVDDAQLVAQGFRVDHEPYPPSTEPTAHRLRRAHAALQTIDAAVRARHPGYDRYAELEDPGPHSLFAIFEEGSEPQLAKFTSNTETWADVGDVLAIGGWLLGLDQKLAAEMVVPGPATLADCVRLVAGWTHDFLERVFGYQDAFAMVRETGTRPCLSWPLYAVAMTCENYWREEITECSID